jgi:hypothetical protein
MLMKRPPFMRRHPLASFPISGVLHQMTRFAICLGCILTFAFHATSLGQAAADSEPALPKSPTSGEVWVQDIPGTASSLTMRPVTLPDGGEMWVMEREVTWNLFDVFIFRLDEKKKKSNPDSDAVTRPTKPYIAVDRGFGHNDYPALSMSLKGAVQFAKWISAKTGRMYRIPTVEEWKIICAQAKIPADQVEDYGWYEANSEEKTHLVGTKKADALGLHDLYGNVGEWCLTGGTDKKPEGVLMGGGYESPASSLNCESNQPYDMMWNDSDPQFPKSIWWFADAAYVGIRLIHVHNEDGQMTSQEKDDDHGEE